MWSHGISPILVALATTTLAAIKVPHAGLPIVDLKYTLQQATPFVGNAQVYNFSNIRFAEPPVGHLRFAPPVPAKENRTIQTSEVSRVCYQALPGWAASQTASQFNSSKPASGAATELPALDPRETEDCLFLDVYVPKNVYDHQSNGSGAAVLVWIYGGGYVEGDKTGNGSPVGLLSESAFGTGGSVIYVAMNYRLGAFGWLAGPTLQADGTANVGLLDQRLALEWVQEHIEAFGGDPKRVTVFGESAGGGSIMHQITAYGGNKGPVPFQQAVPQSAAFQPTPGNFQPEQATQAFLSALNVSTIQAARGLSSLALRDANYEVVGGAGYGQFTFGPVVDGDFVPALPGKLLLQGSFNKDLKLLIGHNSNEGLLFTNPNITTDGDYENLIKSEFPNAPASVISYISEELYPPVFSGLLPYKDDLDRAAFTVSEAVFTCNTNYLARAFGNKTYNYIFSVPPGLHGQDVAYTYYGSGVSSGVLPLPINATVAVALQKYITEFAETGAPSEAGVPHFDIYGPNAQVLNLGADGIDEIVDPTANTRCLWWQKALYY
ncbi:MAG: hypothetical protein M1838_003785 [Thelocarpon superellum]|nr:MAG: hypothetical protein M1838_003785 [Thelocarpon superellum]